VRRGLLTAAVLAAALACATTTDAAAPRRLAAFSGTGSWVSIYDTHALRHPGQVIATLRAHRIHTLFLETSNDRQRHDVTHPVAIARLLDAAHDAGIAVVGWYLPSFTHPRREVARALAGARFRSPAGNGFSAFALDIESTAIRALRVRSARAVEVARGVRAGLPRATALGAITIDPAGGRYWNGYPFAQLARSVDVFLPMEYFTYRTHGVRRVAAYSTANVRLVRRLAGDPRFPVQPIGGDALTATMPALRAFLRASNASGTLGVSLWEYGGTRPREWAALESSR
jgi:hypothetical protein